MKRITALLLCLVMLNFNMIAFATETEEITSEKTYSTGSLDMSVERASALLERIPMIVDIKPNQLYKERLYNELGNNAVQLFSNSSFTTVPNGNEIVTEQDNTAEMLTLTESISYPSTVDNSLEDTFPAIKNQGTLNSCLGWSLGYYQLTNNANKIRGTAAKDGIYAADDKIYSPNWVYNLGNDGTDEGMYLDDAINVLYTYGCPTIDDVMIRTNSASDSYYRSWYPEASIWENALYNKCDIYYGSVNPDNLNTPITSPDCIYLDDLKGLLANGYVVTIETYVSPNSDNYMPIVSTGYTSNNSSAYVWTEVRDNNDTDGHAVTIVGYDDGFKVDINMDGIYQTGEYGAFKIANSWGLNEPKHNDGYVWLAYDALNAVSSVNTSVHTDRTPAFRDGDAYYFIKPQKNYKPLLTAEVSLSTTNREGLEVTIGIQDAVDKTHYIEKCITVNTGLPDIFDPWSAKRIAFGNSYGNCTLTGYSRYSSNVDGTVVFDLTTLLLDFEVKKSHNYNVYIELKDYSNTETTTITSCVLKDHYSGETFSSTDVPLSITTAQDTISANISYSGSITTAPPDKTAFALTFNNKLDEKTVNDTIITLTDSNGISYSLDISLDSSKEKIRLLRQNNILNNDFYNINISPTLRSIGGNCSNTTTSYPLYIPFH